MVSGGEKSFKCYEAVHKAQKGSWIKQSWAVERPCTLEEIAEKKDAVEKAGKAQAQLRALEQRWEQYNRLMAQCEKRFGPTICNR